MAGDDISRAAIHLIETGQSRPSLPTLRLIARRTGKPIEYFLKPGQEGLIAEEDGRQVHVVLDEVELALAQERFKDAVVLADDLAKSRLGDADAARAALLLAQAHLKLANVEPALPLLAQAQSYYESTQDHWQLVEVLDWRAAAEHLLQDPRALATARSALRLAQSLSPVPQRSVVRILGRIGAVCVAQHKWQQAIEAYERAVTEGDSLRDWSRLAKMFNDLSIAYRRLGKFAAAREYARKAIDLHERLQDRLSVARAETNLALVLMHQHEFVPAEAALEDARLIFEETGQKRGRSNIYLALAELELARGQYELAGNAADAAQQLADELGERGSLAESHQILGTLAFKAGNNTEGHRHFERAISILIEMDLAERLTTVRSAYATALEEIGAVQGALEQWRLAVAASHPEAAAAIIPSRVARQPSEDTA